MFVNYRLFLRVRYKLAKGSYFKDRFPKEHRSGVESYYGESVRHLNVRIGKHIRISSLPKMWLKPTGSAGSNHFLLCNNLRSLNVIVC